MDWLLFGFSLILIISGSVLLASCLSQRNYELTHNKCPVCECEDSFRNNYEPTEEQQHFLDPMDEDPEVVH